MCVGGGGEAGIPTHLPPSLHHMYPNTPPPPPIHVGGGGLCEGQVRVLGGDMPRTGRGGFKVRGATEEVKEERVSMDDKPARCYCV